MRRMVLLLLLALAMSAPPAYAAGICSPAIAAVCAKYANALIDANITSTPLLGSASRALKATLDGYEGNLYLNGYNAVRPTVVDRDTTPLVAADGKPSSGCYVVAILDVWAQDNQYGKKINAQLQGVQFFKDGDAFAGGKAADAGDFAPIAEGADAEDLV